MIEPSPRSISFLNAYRPSSLPTGAPSTCRMPPKFDCTSTPTVYPPSDFGTTRDDVPMPPFQPNACVPAPAPTLPSPTGPVFAPSRAARTCSGRIGRDRIAFSPPSFVSPTTGLIEPTRSIPGCAIIQSTIASAAFHTHSVHVSRIGVSSSPSSFTCVLPTSFPNALPT
jgi:hypothetical protein